MYYRSLHGDQGLQGNESTGIRVYLASRVYSLPESIKRNIISGRHWFSGRKVQDMY